MAGKGYGLLSESGKAVVVLLEKGVRKDEIT